MHFITVTLEFWTLYRIVTACCSFIILVLVFSGLFLLFSGLVLAFSGLVLLFGVFVYLE